MLRERRRRGGGRRRWSKQKALSLLLIDRPLWKCWYNARGPEKVCCTRQGGFSSIEARSRKDVEHLYLVLKAVRICSGRGKVVVKKWWSVEMRKSARGLEVI